MLGKKCREGYCTDGPLECVLKHRTPRRAGPASHWLFEVDSAIDVFAVSDAEDQHEYAVVFDLADEPVVADAVFPEFAEQRAVQGLAYAARIVQLGYSLAKEFQDALAGQRVEFVQFPVG